LPFSALYGKKISNLITAGRCISVTDSMWDITRVIPVCAVSGQAAGTASAITDDFASTDIKKLQELLKNSGVVLHEKEL
ncbi:MAG: FAD-dependent oxidoreductase, partial [Clostridia bacterium]|nr:FAD-dependent oxidoreductase [Clostridia bacterium]